MKENNNKIQIQNGKYLPLLSNIDFATAEAIFFMGNFDGQFFDSTIEDNYTPSLDSKKIEISKIMLDRIQNPKLYTAFWLDSDVTLKFKRFIYSCFLDGLKPTKIIKKQTQIVEAYKTSFSNKITVVKSNAGTVIDVRMPHIVFIGDYNEASFSWKDLKHYAEVFFSRNYYLNKLTENQLYSRFGTKNKVDIVIKENIENIFTKLSYNIKKKFGGKKVNFDKVIMNPPYDGNLHLKILEKVLDTCGFENGCEVINLSPVRWIADPLAEYKQGSDFKRFYNTIVKNITNLSLISTDTVCKAFNISFNGDLGIYILNNKKQTYNNNFNKKLLVNKLLNNVTITLKDKAEHFCRDGWRCEIKEMLPTNIGNGNSIYAKQALMDLFQLNPINVYYNGYTEDGIDWMNTRVQKRGKKELGTGLTWSIKFNTKQEAVNFEASCKTNFYKNFMALIKYDMHVPFNFLPYMEDYSHVWTDEDYCKFFGLNEEESKFMCRTVDDYRVKDFINYEEF